MIFVDSSVWIDYFGGVDDERTARLQSLLSTERLIIGDLVLTEVLQGYRHQKDFDAALDVLLEFQIISVGGRAVAIQAARNYSQLRALGFTVRKTIDSLIATRCILSGFELLHNDRDFIPFQKHLGLKCVI